jgi:hypothetical protein
MTHAEYKDLPESSNHLCPRCGQAVRLIGSEAHPVQPGYDLLTYCCTSCEAFLALPVKEPARLRLVENEDDIVADLISRAAAAPAAPLKADNSRMTPIACDACGGHAHLADCAPSRIRAGTQEIWTFECESCGGRSLRSVEV